VISEFKTLTLSYVLIRMLQSRRFIDIHNQISQGEGTIYYQVGKLAFDLLPILLSRIKALGGSQVHRVTHSLRSHPPFYLIKDDSLQLEKVKAAQAIEEFLKV